MSSPDWIEEAHESWMPAVLQALAPAERDVIGHPKHGEGPVAYLIRVARSSKRAKARQIALGSLFPAARERIEGVVELAVDRLFNDPGKFVRYDACRMLALAQDPKILPALETARRDQVEVPWNGIERAIRAIRERNRHAFIFPLGTEANMMWLLQDERQDFKGGYFINGSAAYGTKRS